MPEIVVVPNVDIPETVSAPKELVPDTVNPEAVT